MARRNARPEFAVIGLGRFGRGVALTLMQRGYTVFGIDRDRQLVQELADDLTQTVSLDATDEEALRAVDITSFDTVIVGIGQDFENNLLTTVALKSVGVQRVVCKALSERQKAILLKVGADQVVLPEHEAGQRLAHMLTTPLMLDQLPLGAEYSITELRSPPGYVGKTLNELVTRSRLRVAVVAVKRTAEVVIAPPPELVLAADDVLVAIGPNEQIARFADLA
jgi:trk system potassium uptake protein TrkA